MTLRSSVVSLCHRWYVYNGQVIATDSADASDGPSWDTDWIRVPSYAVEPEAGEVKCAAYVKELTDSLHWIAAINVGLLLPASISEGMPSELHWGLSQAIPNPSGTDAVLRFDVPEGGGTVKLAVYDAAGRMVKTLIDGRVEAGRHLARWNGRNDGGKVVSPGVYFICMEAEGFKATRKLVIVK